MNLTATHINYFFTCKRKLWLFSRNITCEHTSENVKIGKFYHEDLESIEIDNIKIDKLQNGKVFELKKRNSAPEAAKFQVLFYLKKLRDKGIETTGLIKYKENNRLEPVQLDEKNESELQEAIRESMSIISQALPLPAKKIKYCRHCSYYELCFT